MVPSPYAAEATDAEPLDQIKAAHLQAVLPQRGQRLSWLSGLLLTEGFSERPARDILPARTIRVLFLLFPIPFVEAVISGDGERVTSNKLRSARSESLAPERE